jgi:hypothetical protein
MSKVETLIRFITYHKQHPSANGSQIARAIGVTPQYVVQCKKETNLLKHYLAEAALEPHHLRLLLSLLDRRNPHQREVYEQLQRVLLPTATGVLRMARSGEKRPLEMFTLGAVETKSPDYSQVLDFWLSHLCYEPLVRMRPDGAVEARLASAMEAREVPARVHPERRDFSQWHITIRGDVHWSDGAPLTLTDVLETLTKSPLARFITEIKPVSPTQLALQLSDAAPLLPLHLTGIVIHPSHVKEPYRVTNGAYRLRRLRKNAVSFRLERNRDYYREPDLSIDLLTLKRFHYEAHAIGAVRQHQLDFLLLRSLQLLYQKAPELSPQQCPFSGEAHYLLFLNRCRGLLKEKKNGMSLQQAIDYSAIHRYLHAGHSMDVEPRRPLAHELLNIKIACDHREAADLAYLIGKSVGASLVNPVFVGKDLSWSEMREQADAFLTSISFGMGYNRLSRYFQSDGRNNPFAYANSHVDALLSQLDQTADMPKRQAMGQHVLSLLQDDGAVILLSPCYDYILSPLTIQFDENLTSILDVAQNMSRLVVERRPRR